MNENDELLAEVESILNAEGWKIEHKNRPEFPPHSTRIGQPRYLGRGRVFGG